MKLAWSTDAHVGNYGKNGGWVRAGVNQRCADVLRTLERAVSITKINGCVAHLHLGDLFDYSRVEPQVERRVQEILDPVPTVLLVGNHDQTSDASMDHAMAPLAPVASIVDTAPIWFAWPQMGGAEVAVLVVPFQAGRAEDWLPQVIADHVKAHGVPEARCVCLAFHLGISDTRTPYFLDGADDSVCLPTVEKLAKAYGFTHVFAGNWHKHDRWTVEGKNGSEVEVIQIGTLAPNRFTDTAGRFGTMALLDSKTGEVRILDVPGPRFVKVHGLDEVRRICIDARGMMDANPLYVSATVQETEQDEAEELLAAQKTGGFMRAYEIHLDRTAEDAKAKTAVAAAVSATSHAEAVRVFVQETPLPEAVPREQVQAFVDQCLKEAKSC